MDKITPERKSNRDRNTKIFVGVLVVGIFIMLQMASDKNDTEKELIETTYYVSEVPKDPIVSQWDGSVIEVRDYIKNNLNDWSSYESMEWSNLVKSDDGKTFTVRHKYRAANKFGGLVIEHQLFQISSDGRIIGITDI